LKFSETISKISKRGDETFLCLLFVIITLSSFLVINYLFLTGWKISHADFQAVVYTKNKINDENIGVILQSGINSSRAIVTCNYPFNVSGSGGWDSPNNESYLSIDFRFLSENKKAHFIFENFEFYLDYPISLLPIGDNPNVRDEHIIFKNNIEDSLKEVNTIMIIYADSPYGDIAIYSHYQKYIWENNSFHKETNLYKMLIPETIQFSLIITSLMIGGLVFTIKSGNIPIINRPFPYITFSLSLVTLMLYTLGGTGNEWLIKSGLDIFSKLSVSLLSPFFHADYEHIIGNLSMFIPVSVFFEMWVTDLQFKRFLSYYFFPYVFTIFHSLINVIRDGPAYGISGVIIGLSVILTFFFFLNKNKYKIKKWYDIIPYLATGYFFGASSYRFLSELILYPFSKETIDHACRHLYFFGAHFIFSVLYPPKKLKIRRKEKTFFK